MATGRKALDEGLNELGNETIDDPQQFLKDLLAFLTLQKSEATKMQGSGVDTSPPDKSNFSESPSPTRRNPLFSKAEAPSVTSMLSASMKSGVKISPKNRKVHPHTDLQDPATGTSIAPEAVTWYVLSPLVIICSDH